jgi:predicted nucleotidyltransferase
MVPSPVPGPLLQAIGAVTAWLREAEVPAAVIGGVAASLLGRARVTKDVDLVVALAEEGELPQFLALAKQHGITPRTVDAVDFAKVSRVLLLRHEPSGIEIDISMASLPFERELIERAVERTIRGIVFRVATAEDLIVMKAIALRPRDVADIEALLDMHPQLDLERIRSFLRAFTEALETDDFAAEFERLLARQQRRK